MQGGRTGIAEQGRSETEGGRDRREELPVTNPDHRWW